MVRWPIDPARWRLMMRPLLSVTVLVLLISAAAAVPAAAAPDGQVIWGVHISLAPTWFDPAETPGIVTPFMVLYGLHDAMLKALPGNPLAPALAESWTVSPDGLTYEFVLRPGVELVMEAVEGYWRKTPSVKRLVLRVIPDPTTRYAALKSGEIDVTYWMTASLGEDLRRTPGLTLRPVVSSVMLWVAFVDQWDPKSPWHDRRMRLAANLAIDRQAINQAETLGHSLLTNSIIPNTFDFFWAPPPPQYDRARAKKLLAEAGYPNGLDAGDYTVDAAAVAIGEPVVNSLQAAGIRVKLRPLERAAFQKGYSDKKYRNLVHSGSAAFGNAATRIEAFIASGGAYVYGSYPDIDGLFREQATELDKKRREATLQRIQQLIHEKAMVAPIVQVGLMSGYGPRVEESGLGLITGYSFSAPYEDVRLKGK